MNRTLSLAAFAILEPGSDPDVSFVPPLVRRRLSPLQKIYFALANAVGGEVPKNVVFACRDGEDTLTRRLVEGFHEDGSVSPNRFSTSVYNAAPGLWSIQTINRNPYTAIAAGEDTIECGLIEMLAARPALHVYAEETGGGYGAAAFFSEDAQARQIQMTNGDPSRASVSFRDWVDFLSGRRHELCGRWLTLRDIG